MITMQSEVPWYFELGEQAVHELLLLMSLYDCEGLAQPREMLQNIQAHHYFRQSPSRLSSDLQYHLPDTGYVEQVRSCYQLTKKGKIRLRDLCELAHANPSIVTQINKEGFDRLKVLRTELGMYPFTRGSLVKDEPRERAITAYCVYAILLSETALQLRYRSFNSHHNPKMPCIYVGMSQYKPRERFDNHRFGYKKHSSKYVYDNGLCLVPLIYSHLNKEEMSKDGALELEKELSECLRQHGFAVFAGHHDVVNPLSKKLTY